MKRVSLVIPIWNERERLSRTAAGIERLRDCLDGELEVLLVDDGSTDGSASVAESMNLPVLRRDHRGKGAAVRAGMLTTGGRYRVQADADWSMPPEQCLRLIDALTRGADVALACREHHDSTRTGEPLWRHGLGRAWNRVVQGLVLPGVEDSQCGFKAFVDTAAQRLFSTSIEDGWAADVEILAWARAWELQMRTIPIDWTHDPDSRVHPLRDGLAMLRSAIRVRRRLEYRR